MPKFPKLKPTSRFHLFYFLSIFSLFFLLPNGAKAITNNTTEIGAIIDLNSRIGREMKVSMELAVSNFNKELKNHKLSLNFQDSHKNPLQAAKAAERLVEESKVEALIGMERWEEAALVADTAKVPILSFSAPSIQIPLANSRWPNLVSLADDDLEQMRCISELIRAYSWRRVVTINEDYGYGGNYGEFSVLTQALKEVNSEVEHRIILPSFSLLSDPENAVRKELEKLEEVQSRVFVVLQTSFDLVISLFKVAKQMRFVGKDTVWILTNSVTGFLDSFDTSVIYSMEGAIGVKSYYSDTSDAYRSFHSRFRRKFQAEYPEEDNSEPGFYALRAYDTIATIFSSIQRDESRKISMGNIKLSDFIGLSGRISFKAGELLQNPELRIVNVVGKKYKEIDFWFSGSGFRIVNDGDVSMGLEGPVNWPGDLKRVPKGWKMPSSAKPMKIGVPGRTDFDKFVKVEDANNDKYDGFCIELFYKILEMLNYSLPYKFEPFNGSYDDLVNNVYNKTFDAVVGDITILAERAKRVEFTQPYAESGLSMIVRVKSEESAWMFMKPFTWEMWAVTGTILIYTMFVVWFLEHRKNPEFQGPLKNQIGHAVFFTFSSLFFAHREKVHGNLTRFVVVVWLFVVLILNSSYTASLTSMLTIQRLQPNVTDIDWLKRNNLPVGSDTDSFVTKYLENVLDFKPENIRNFVTVSSLPEEFNNRTIYAAFLELPYQKLFTNLYCRQYYANSQTYRFGGLGFVFQKGSPIAADFSRAILELSENGNLKELEEKWFIARSKCENNGSEGTTESLSVRSFWGLFLISGATSTICFLIFLVRVVKQFWQYQKEEQEQGNSTPGNQSVWNKTVTLVKYYYRGENGITGRSPDVEEWVTPGWESSGSSKIPERNSDYSVADTEVGNVLNVDSENLRDSGDQQGSIVVDIPDPEVHRTT